MVINLSVNYLLPFQTSPPPMIFMAQLYLMEGLQPDTGLTADISSLRNSVWGTPCSFARPGGNTICKLKPIPRALHEEKKSSPPQAPIQMTVIRESHHSRPGEGGDIHSNWRHYMKPHCAYKKKKENHTQKKPAPFPPTWLAFPE